MEEAPDILSLIAKFACERPEVPAFIFPRGSLSFAELDRFSSDYAMALAREGIGLGTKAVMMIPPGREFFLVGFALLKLGAVLVLIDPGMGWPSLKQCLAEAAPEAFIGVGRAHVGRSLFGWAKETLKTRVCVGPFGFPGAKRLRTAASRVPASASMVQKPELSRPAAIVFTSGSTGVPKGVVYTHEMFATQIALFRSDLGIEPGDVNLATFAPFAFIDPGLGATSVLPRMNFMRPASVNPKNLLRPIEKFKVKRLFGSPALLRRLTEYVEKNGVSIPHISRVLSAGAPVPFRLLEKIVNHLPAGAEVLTPYGATEGLPLTSIAAAEILHETREGTRRGEGVCIGRPMSGVQLKLMRITDEPALEWRDELEVKNGSGEIVVWGKNVSREYYGRDSANLAHKIRTPAGDIGHRTGDIGCFDDKGRLWFYGRKAHRVQGSFGTLFSVPCEGVFDQHPDVYRTALIGLGRPPVQVPVLCVEMTEEGKNRDLESVRKELLALGAKHEVTRVIERIFFHPAFPVDIRHNAKIFRERLVPWAQARLEKT